MYTLVTEGSDEVVAYKHTYIDVVESKVFANIFIFKNLTGCSCVYLK